MPFLFWDYVFAKERIWWFNSDYIFGIHVGSLPLEEIVFFFCIPYACLYTYWVIKTHFPKWIGPFSKPLRYGLFVIAFALTGGAVFFHDLAYTGTVMALGSVGLWWLAIKNPSWSKLFGIFFLIHLIPFFLVNGLLTGIPVVLYDNKENLGIRMGTIPVEDSIFSFCMMLLVVSIFEKLNKQKNNLQR